MFYVIFPIIMMKNALDTIRKGNDDERLSDWDPFKLVSRFSRFNGILELLGFGPVKSKHIILLSGAEQLGEASIQTILAAIFIIQNHASASFEDFDNLLGVPFPTSIVSLVFSIISVLIATKNVAVIVFEKARTRYQSWQFY